MILGRGVSWAKAELPPGQRPVVPARVAAPRILQKPRQVIPVLLTFQLSQSFDFYLVRIDGQVEKQPVLPQDYLAGPGLFERFHEHSSGQPIGQGGVTWVRTSIWTPASLAVSAAWTGVAW